MLLIGLTGSIATGKSTVSQLLSQPPHSLPIIDADLLARQVVEPGTRGYRKILAHFGPTTPDLLLPASSELPHHGINGKGRPLNRAALGRQVFGDSEERRRDRKVLNGIVHPAVRRAMAWLVLKYYLMGHWAVVLDIPLLFESGLDVFCGTVIVVAVRDPVVQMRRLRERDPHLSPEEAEDRVRSQGDVSEKAERVEAMGERGKVVWNGGGKEDLRGELERVVGQVRRRRKGWWSWVLLGFPPMAVLRGVLGVWRGWVDRKRWQGMEREKQTEKAKL